MGLFDRVRPKPKPVPRQEDEYIVPNTPTVMPVNRRRHPRINARPGTQALIIDDSRTVVEQLGRRLRSSGFLVIDTDDAESGIEIARSEMPHIIFLDIMLPGMHGFSALRKIRRDPELEHIPVVVMTADVRAQEYYRTHDVAADGFLRKPVSRADLFTTIQRLLDLNRSPRRLETATSVSEPVSVDTSEE